MLDGLQGSDYQLDISAECPDASAIQVVNDDGTLECRPLEPAIRPSLPVGVLPQTILAQPPTSLAVTIGSDGLPVMAYKGVGGLNVLKCGNFDCNSGNTTQIISSDVITLEVSQHDIIIDKTGFPAISFYNHTLDALQLARCSDMTCSSYSLLTVDDPASGFAGRVSALTMDKSGDIAIAYESYNGAEYSLYYAVCSTVTCLTNNVSGGGYGSSFNSIDMLGVPNNESVIVVSVETLIHYYACDPSFEMCNSTYSAQIAVVSANSPAALSIAPSGLPVMAYIHNNVLTVVACDDMRCQSPGFKTVASPYQYTSYVSIVVDRSGIAWVSGWTTTGRLTLARCTDSQCSDAIRTGVNLTDAGAYNTLTLNAFGLPFLAYSDAGVGSLSGFNCPNDFCASYNRRP